MHSAGFYDFFFLAFFQLKKTLAGKVLAGDANNCIALEPINAHVGVQLYSQECKAGFLRLRNQMCSQVAGFYEADFLRCVFQKARILSDMSVRDENYIFWLFTSSAFQSSKTTWGEKKKEIALTKVIKRKQAMCWKKEIGPSKISLWVSWLL